VRIGQQPLGPPPQDERQPRSLQPARALQPGPFVHVPIQPKSYRCRALTLGVTVWLGLAAVACLATGCGTSISRKAGGQPRQVFKASGRSEVVFHGAGLAMPVATLGPGSESSRRDASLNIRHPETAFAYGSWPVVPQPSLDQARRLHLPTNAESHLYISRERQEWRSNWRFGPDESGWE